MKKIFYNLFLWCAIVIGGLSVSQAASSPYDAARNGDLDALRQYRFDGIDLFVPDERGFIPYELAALHADPDKPDELRKNVEIMLWLKEYQPEKHVYGKASISLVQAGLNALGYPVGAPDGIMGEKTSEAIKTYQSQNNLAETGKLGPQWLGMFFQDVVKDMQFKLTRLGYDTKGTDGLMGANTRDAMLAYRSQKQLADSDYSHVDALLINSLNNTYGVQEQKRKAAIAEKEHKAQEAQTKYAQAGLSMLGYRIGKVDGVFGSKTSNAVKSFQKKYQLPVTGDVDSKTKVKMQIVFLKEAQRKLSYLGYKTGGIDGKMGPKTTKALASYHKNKKISGVGLTSGLMISLDNNYDVAIAKSKKTKSVKKAPSTTKSKTTASTDVKKPAVTTNKKTSSINASSAKGAMSFSRSGGRVVGCSLAGRKIPIEWCEPFYPLPKNNHCEATFKPSSGAVINLWCK